jgi:hypothetical protein
MANPADTFGLQSVSGVPLWQCWICQRYKGSHSASPESRSPSQILVERAGNNAVNGLYRQNGLSDIGGLKYRKENGHNHQGRDHDVYILPWYANADTIHWFICSVPVGTDPGSSADIDYYTCPIVDDDFVTPPAAGWVVSDDGRSPAPRVSLLHAGDGGEVQLGDGKCILPKHRRRVLRFLPNPSNHSIDERRSVISTFFEPRIDMLVSAADRRELHEMLYFYLQSKKGVVPVFARLDWFEHKDRLVLSMLAAWRNLAQSRADDDPVDVRHIKKARTLRDLWLEHRHDWKLHKQQVLDAGQVHLVGKLVRPFLEVVNSFMLTTV